MLRFGLVVPKLVKGGTIWFQEGQKGSTTDLNIFERVVDEFYVIRRYAEVSERYQSDPKSSGGSPRWP